CRSWAESRTWCSITPGPRWWRASDTIKAMRSKFPWPAEGPRRVPSTVYTDRSTYQREQQRIFRGRSWNYVGLATEVAKPGDFVQTYVGETPVVLVRDREGQLRAF